MNNRPSGDFARDFTKGLCGILTLAMVILLATPAGAAGLAGEPTGEPGHINLLRPDRLLLQITMQSRGEATRDTRRMPVAYISGQDRGYRDVSRSNLLNSPAARYLARALTGTGNR
ncbi:MAG: hypothetical protein IID51_14010 [Proteobacteria bacterium]|nr:hypothetical protein [Pseudomonadota bacterium]